MYSFHRYSTLVVCLLLLFSLAACHKKDGGGVGAVGPVTITLSADANNNCVQSVGGVPTPVVDVERSQTVNYVSPSPLCSADLMACPFGNCPASCGNGSGVRPNAVLGQTMYSSIVIGANNNCNNPGQLGLRIKPTP